LASNIRGGRGEWKGEGGMAAKREGEEGGEDEKGREMEMRWR